MTKKHFIKIADKLRESKPSDKDTAKLTQWLEDREIIADYFAAVNPRFNRERWLDYIDGKCGPNGGRVK